MYKEVKHLIKAFVLSSLGVGSMQINSFLDMIFVSFAHPSGPVYLWYANRFQQFVLAIFGIAAVHTLVPRLSRVVKGGDVEKGKKIFTFGYRMILMLMFPMTCAIYVLSFSGIDLIFGWGNFSPFSVYQTAECLKAYGLGLIPATCVMWCSAVFHAQGNFRTPMISSLITVAINIGLNVIFVFVLKFGAISTALATTISAWCNYLMLYAILSKKGWRIQQFLRSFGHIVFAVLFASVTVFFCETPLRQISNSKFFIFISSGLLFVGILTIYAYLFKLQKLKELVQ